MVEKALRGEWIPAEELDYINEQRFHNDQPYLLIHPRRYEDEKAELQILRKQAKKDFLFQSAQYKKHLHKISEAGDLSTICDQVNRSATSGEQDEKDEINREIGQWFSDYLTDSGYYPHTDSVLIKQAIMHSFPNLGNTQEEGFTPDNIEPYMLSSLRGYTSTPGWLKWRDLTNQKIRLLPASCSKMQDLLCYSKLSKILDVLVVCGLDRE